MTRLRLPLAGLALMSILTGCTAAALQVSSAGTAADVNYLWLASTLEGERTRFTPADDKVTLAVRFAPNLIAYYKRFRVEWVTPGGGVYLKRPVRTQWGSHQELATSLPIAGTTAATLPGRWSVRLFHHQRLLTEREFEIAPNAQENLAAAEQVPTTPPPPVAAGMPGVADRAPEE